MPSEKCSKCGNYTHGSESNVGSYIMSGVKIITTIVGETGKALNYLPNGRVIGFFIKQIPNLVPTRVIQFKCLCGHSWTRIDKK